MIKFRKLFRIGVWGLFVPSKSYKLGDQKKSEIDECSSCFVEKSLFAQISFGYYINKHLR